MYKTPRKRLRIYRRMLWKLIQCNHPHFKDYHQTHLCFLWVHTTTGIIGEPPSSIFSHQPEVIQANKHYPRHLLYDLWWPYNDIDSRIYYLLYIIYLTEKSIRP